MQITKEYLIQRGWTETPEAIYKDFRNSEDKLYRVGWNTGTHILYIGYGQMPFPVETTENLNAILSAIGLQENNIWKNFLDTAKHLRDLAEHVYPGKFKYVCAQEGITENSAMDMYANFQSIVKGFTPYRDRKPLTLQEMEKIILLAEKAEMFYTRHNRIIPTAIFNTTRYGYLLNHVLVVWTPEGSDEDQYLELDLSRQDTYVTIGKIADNGGTIKAVIRQADKINDTSGCMSLDEEKRGNSSLYVYDGDVILAYLDKPGFWSSDAKKCGLYLCTDGAYYKLLYTPGKGYVRKGKPDTDEDFKVDVEENAFSNNILTLSQKYKKVGNIHVSIDFLVEKK